jgi:hypothetical protein
MEVISRYSLTETEENNENPHEDSWCLEGFSAVLGVLGHRGRAVFIWGPGHDDEWGE